MLLEFRVKNFCSLRDEQVFSLVASKDKTLEDMNTINTDISTAPRLLKSAVIYGANAGGKSNLIKALQYMRSVVLESASIKVGDVFSVRPFLLDNFSQHQPTEFEVTFLIDGIRHQYGFTMTAQRIISEYLLVYKAFKPRCLFDRRFDPQTGKDEYDFQGLKGQKQSWKAQTKQNSLFLSIAVRLNSEYLRPIFDWFAKDLIIINEYTPLGVHSSIQRLKQTETRKKICEFLAIADISIDDISIDWVEQCNLRFRHTTEYGTVEFDLMDESSGTRHLLFLVGPVLDILEKGSVLIIDELNTSLHALLVRELIRLFHNPSLNTKGAKLIFTTHDVSLLDAQDLFRRDQVWFVDKKSDQASSVIGLSEFSPRKNEALVQGYTMGRYGAIPSIIGHFGLNIKFS